MGNLILIATCASVAAGATIRGANNILQQEEPLVGLPSGGVPIEPVPILPYHLDFAAGLKDSDFVFDVHPFLTSRPPNQGEGGTVSGRESSNTPALQGQGIALSLFTLRPGGQNLIHYHPRATELLLVFRGEIEVGFTDTTGALHLNNVRAGQATIFPRGMLHFQRNIGEEQAEYISILNDEIPGVMSFPRVLLGMPTHIIAQAFRTDEATVDALKERLLPPHLSPGGENENYDGAAGPLGNAPVPGVVGEEPTMPPKYPPPHGGGYDTGYGGGYGGGYSNQDVQKLFEKLLEAIKNKNA